jgi:hypothetical protein
MLRAIAAAKKANDTRVLVEAAKLALRQTYPGTGSGPQKALPGLHASLNLQISGVQSFT